MRETLRNESAVVEVEVEVEVGNAAKLIRNGGVG